MLEEAFKEIDTYLVKERNALHCNTLSSCWHAVRSEKSALENVASKQNTFKPFLVIIGTCRGEMHYFEDFMKLIDDPNPPTVYSLILEKYRIVVEIVVLLVEAKIISTKPNTKTFSEYDLSKCNGNEKQSERRKAKKRQCSSTGTGSQTNVRSDDEAATIPKIAVDENAGEIPRPVAPRPDNEQTEGCEDPQAEIEIGQRARGCGKSVVIMYIFLPIFLAIILNYLLSSAFEASVTLKINRDGGIEVASFCLEKK